MITESRPNIVIEGQNQNDEDENGSSSGRRWCHEKDFVSSLVSERTDVRRSPKG